jgi:hypothetical protein
MLQGVVHEFTASAVTDAKALQDAQNSAAKNVADFLNNLVAGPSSTSSPIATLASANTLYNANLPLAQAGNVDAQNKFVSLADNLEKAARVVYASGTGYQDIKNQIINQGLNLPAVQATTDPVTAAVRDAITAIQIGNAAQATNATLTGSILPAVNAGNAAAVAASLATYFNQIDPSGKLNSVVANTLGVWQQTGNLSLLDPINAKVNTNNTLTGTTNSLTDAGNSTLAAIQGLQLTATNQLNLLNSAVNPAANGVILTYTVTGAGTSAPTTDHTTFTDQMLTTLYKIEINTWATAGNTRGLSGGAARDGLHAAGGLITGPGTGTSDSIRAMLSNREFVIKNAAVERFGVGFFEQLNAGIMPPVFNDNRPINVAAPVFRGGGGDNGSSAALLAEVKRLNEKIDRLERVVAGSGANIARTVMEGTDKVADKVDNQTGALASQERQSNRQRKVANG